MPFRMPLWQNAIGACFEPEMREMAEAAWASHPTYFFELFPYVVHDGKPVEQPLRLFENFYPLFTEINKILEELLENDAKQELDWQPMQNIWTRLRPWWQKFNAMRDSLGDDTEIIVAMLDEQGLLSAHLASLMYPMNRLAETIESEIPFGTAQFELQEEAADFITAISEPALLMDMLRQMNAGTIDLVVRDEATEIALVEILTHCIQAIRELYIWLATCRIHLGTKRLASLERVS